MFKEKCNAFMQISNFYNFFIFLPSTTIKDSVFRPSASNLYFPANSSVTLWILSLWKVPSFVMVIPSDD